MSWQEAIAELRAEIQSLRTQLASVPVAQSRPSAALRAVITESTAAVNQVVSRDYAGGLWFLASPTDTGHDRSLAVVLGRLAANRILVGFAGRHRLAEPLDEDFTTYALDPDSLGDLVPLATLTDDGMTPRIPVLYHYERGEVEIFGPSERAGSTAAVQSVTQEAHGLVAGDAVHLSAGTWAKATHDDTTDHVGLVVQVVSADAFVVCLSGRARYVGAVAGAVYYLNATAGAVQTTRPTRDFGDKIRALCFGVAEDLVEVLPANLITGHEHVVDDGAIGLSKLDAGDPSDKGFLLGGGTIDGSDVVDHQRPGWPGEPETWPPFMVPAISKPGGIGNRSLVWVRPAEIAQAGVELPSWSVYGKEDDASAQPAAIVADTDQRVLARRDNIVGFFKVSAAMLDDTAVTPGSYGSGSLVPQFAVDAQGRITSAANFEPDLAGDVTGKLSTSVVAQLQGYTWPAGAPNERDFAIFDGAGWAFSQVLTTRGQLFARNATQTFALNPGSKHQVLSMDNEDTVWRTLIANRGGLLTRDADGLAEVGPGTAGQVLLSNGSEAEPSFQGFPDFLKLPGGDIADTSYSSGSGTHTFTKKYYMAILLGAGGGGSGGQTSPDRAGNGGGQGERVFVVGVAPSSASYAVGAGGAGGGAGSNGSTGGSTSLIISALGGQGGQVASGGGRGGSVNNTTPGIDLDLASQALVWRIRGEGGHRGCLTTSLISTPGRGGGVSGRGFHPGDGGLGGTPGSAGEAGEVGRIRIIEWD